MKKFAVVIMAVAVAIFGVSAGASAHNDDNDSDHHHHHGGHYPIYKPMVAPGKAVIGPKDTVGIFATKFCPNQPITITLKKGSKVLTKTSRTNDRGAASFFVSKLKVGTWIIKATACGDTATSKLTVRDRHRLGSGDSGTSIAESFGAIQAGMDARSAAAADVAGRSVVPALSSGSDSDGLAVTQIALVGLLCAAGLGGVTVVRRRSRSVA